MKYGVLLVAAGTPQNASAEASRAYADRVLGTNLYTRGLGFVQAQMFSKATIPAKAKEWRKYFTVEVTEDYRSSLQSLGNALQATLAQESRKKCIVAVGMRCGTPSLDEAVLELKAAKCDVVIALPLYALDFKPLVDPALKEVADAVARARDASWSPRLNEIRSFVKTPGYIKSLAECIEKDWEYRNVSRVLLLMPSMPRALSESDPTFSNQVDYLKEQLTRRLKIGSEHVHLSFVCEFDNDKWVGPFAEKMLMGWVGGAVRDVKAVAPVFCVADALGTYDAGFKMGDYFRRNVLGAKPAWDFVCLGNDTQALARVLCDTVKRVL